MSTARETILASIRRSLRVAPGDETRHQSVDGRIEAARPGIQPARGQGSLHQRIETFERQAAAVSATVTHVETAAAIPAEIARYLRNYNLPLTLRRGDDGLLSGLPWREAALEVSIGPSKGDDLNAVSRAEAAIAETGTLALVSGPHNPTTLNFLPDNHVVIVDAADIHATYEDIFPLVRARYGTGAMPRTLSFVTGPSRSADIEQKLLLGAHGPRRLHIVIFGSRNAAGRAP